MDFKEAVRTCLRKTFTLSGRASRSEFWWFYLFLHLMLVALLALMYLVTGKFDFYPIPRGSYANPIAIVVILVVAVALIVPFFTVQVRRFHDLNLSGWWVVWGALGANIPSVGWIAIVAMHIVYLMQGTGGENRHGPDPLRVEDGDDAATTNGAAKPLEPV